MKALDVITHCEKRYAKADIRTLTLTGKQRRTLAAMKPYLYSITESNAMPMKKPAQLGEYYHRCLNRHPSVLTVRTLTCNYLTIQPVEGPEQVLVAVSNEGKKRLKALKGERKDKWCRRRDLNPHTLAGARP
jgi:hypothetical protein